MGPEFVTVAAGGQVWSAFEEVTLSAAHNEAARSFRLMIAAEPGPMATAWTFKAGTQISILFNGELVLTGYVDRYQPAMHEHSQAIIAVSGRGKGQDVIDCAALHKTGRFNNKTVLEIAQELDKFGVGFRTDQQLKKIPWYQITPGETVFRALEKLCRQQKLTMAGQADGSILITKAGKGSHAPLYEGVNIKSASADHNWSGRHSKAFARGQRPVGTGKKVLEVEQTAEDGSVKRFRPVVIHIDDDTDDDRAKNRAKHRLAQEAGHAIKAHIIVQGFHDDGGQLWTPGNLVWVQSPFLDIRQMMLIERAEFTQSRGQGSITQLNLCDPQAYGGSGGKGGSAGDAWQTEADDS